MSACPHAHWDSPVAEAIWLADKYIVLDRQRCAVCGKRRTVKTEHRWEEKEDP